MATIFDNRINAMRDKMRNSNIDATIIPHVDPHQSEYIADHWQARRWLSGFTGSAGTLVITLDKALLWTDSRYFIQGAEQLSKSQITLMKDGLPDTPSIYTFLCNNLKPGAIVGFDGMLFSIAETENIRKSLSSAGIKTNETFAPINELWTDRPTLPNYKIFIHDEKYTGENTSSKIKNILKNVTAQGANATFISALDEIAWTLNIRSRDVKYNPVATAFLYISDKGSTIFIDENKVDDICRKYFSENNITIASYTAVSEFLASLPADTKVLVEASRTAGALVPALGNKIVCGQSPISMLKGCKNTTQISCLNQAMERDGVALVKLFMEIERRLASGEPTTEMDVDKLATQYRSEHPLYFDDSFGTIAGYREHGAIVHYEATEDTNATLQPEGLLLVDSGAQYLDGTTDITRTVSLGKPTDQERRDFTLVMKGHIALGTMVFPAGTRGAQLDALARQFLWKEGLSYLHGTGHGVGYFLNVHEGPQNIRLNENPTTLTPGMITSNEPGIYREGSHGIRCENLILTVPAFSNEFGDFLKFETLTLFPFDLQLFDTSIMSDDEIKWVNDYHVNVYNRLAPHLNIEQQQWLKNKTLPLTIK